MNKIETRRVSAKETEERRAKRDGRARVRMGRSESGLLVYRVAPRAELHRAEGGTGPRIRQRRLCIGERRTAVYDGGGGVYIAFKRRSLI